MAESMIGIVLDVSNSMESAYALDGSHDASVERTHAILTTIINILKREAVHHKRQESVFASIFGLRKSVGTCDLFAMLEHLKRVREEGDIDIPEDGYEAISDLATKHGAPHAIEWIREQLSREEAATLYRGLRFDPDLIPKMIRLLPSELTRKAVDGGSQTLSTVTDTMKRLPSGTLQSWVNNIEKKVSKAYQDRAQSSKPYVKATGIIEDFNSGKLVEDVLRCMEHPKARPVQEVSTLLDDLLQVELPSASSSSLHDRIRELLKPIKPYILGLTPMCKALKHATDVFRKTTRTRVLFILSDGDSTDGDPHEIAQELHQLDVIIVTCFLTSNHIDNPRRLLYKADPKWRGRNGRQVLFEMSSTMKNTHTPISYLIDANWELPSAGESRLFVQANSLDVVNEFCEIVVSQMTQPCDALVHLLERINLATYINQTNAKFKPKQQRKGTCYANAIAAVFHLAMSRIVGREGGIPDFRKIRDCIIEKYDVEGATTVKVLESICPVYRLHFREVDETGARQAINKRRPVVARFTISLGQRRKFSEFYRMEKKGILRKQNVTDRIFADPQGHAVVLTGCDSDCLTFMNSWGHEFADGGFFRVEDQNVLHQTTFYDIYWIEADLTQSEKDVYERKGIERSRELLHTYHSLEELTHECPKCSRTSNIGEFYGHVLEAKCPICHKKFKPTNSDIIESLYRRARNL
ncbi:uncharacterized protein LOC134177092 [Corticium candelabrum]|uniref:uncharacterized protein LOC134177092 n=1 Tax=Corticium candelabrum TaxID=121492 RepID=UPI002E25BC90|nr:uncharacterized protein LOC134177092 [Corticium candelabrum]